MDRIRIRVVVRVVVRVGTMNVVSFVERCRGRVRCGDRWLVRGKHMVRVRVVVMGCAEACGAGCGEDCGKG